MKRSIITVVLSVFLFCGVVLAQQPNDPTTKEDVQHLLDLMHARENTAAMIDSMKQQLPSLLAPMMNKEMSKLTPEERKLFEEFRQNMYQKAFENMPIKEMMDASIPVYQRNFTHADIAGLIEFYSSPAGQKMVAIGPTLMKECMEVQAPIVQKWMGTRMAELQKQTDEFVRSMQDRLQNSETPHKKKS